MLFRWIALILVVRHLQCLHQLVAGVTRHDDRVSRLFPLPDALQAYGRQWQGFRAEYAQTRLRKILPETALPPDLAAAIKPYATFASVYRERVADGISLNYTIGYYL